MVCRTTGCSMVCCFFRVVPSYNFFYVRGKIPESKHLLNTTKRSSGHMFPTSATTSFGVLYGTVAFWFKAFGLLCVIPVKKPVVAFCFSLNDILFCSTVLFANSVITIVHAHSGLFIPGIQFRLLICFHYFLEWKDLWVILDFFDIWAISWTCRLLLEWSYWYMYKPIYNYPLVR